MRELLLYLFGHLLLCTAIMVLLYVALDNLLNIPKPSDPSDLRTVWVGNKKYIVHKLTAELFRKRLKYCWDNFIPLNEFDSEPHYEDPDYILFGEDR